MMSRTGKILLYSAYSMGAVIFFLVVLFPSEALKHMLMQQVADIQPDLGVQAQSIDLVFPPGIKLAPVSVAYTGRPVLNIDQLKIRPALFSLLSDTKKFVITGVIGSGTLEGRAEWNRTDKNPQTKFSMNLINVPLEMLEVVRQWPQYQPSGDVNAFIDFDSQRSGAGTTNVNLDLTGVAITMNPPLMGLDRLDFSTVAAEIAITPRMMQIKRCEANGLQMEGKVTGSVIFRHPLGDSRMTLSCTVKPLPAFVAEHKNDLIGGFLSSQTAQKRGIVFRISGTIDNPNYVMR